MESTALCPLTTTTAPPALSGFWPGIGLASGHEWERSSRFRVARALCGGGERLGPDRRFTMKTALPKLIAAVAAAGVVFTSPGDKMAGHQGGSPQGHKGGAGPGKAPVRGGAAIPFGEPGKGWLFVPSLKFPRGYRVPPHTHPVDEVL